MQQDDQSNVKGDGEDDGAMTLRSGRRAVADKKEQTIRLERLNAALERLIAHQEESSRRINTLNRLITEKIMGETKKIQKEEDPAPAERDQGQTRQEWTRPEALPERQIKVFVEGIGENLRGTNSESRYGERRTPEYRTARENDRPIDSRRRDGYQQDINRMRGRDG